MKKLIVLSVAGALALAVGAGCGGKRSTTSSSSAGSLTPTAPPPPQSTVVPPTVETPVPGATSTTPVPAETAAGAPTPGSRYVVRKGDTLWNIATRAYGDGKQWQKIATANRITGNAIKEGQTLTLP